MNRSEEPLRDIEERTFKFAIRIIKLCKFLEGKSWVNSTLGRQLLRSGTSIGSNVEEALAFATAFGRVCRIKTDSWRYRHIRKEEIEIRNE